MVQHHMNDGFNSWKRGSVPRTQGYAKPCQIFLSSFEGNMEKGLLQSLVQDIDDVQESECQKTSRVDQQSAAGSMYCSGGSMMVTGGRDGSINVWSCHRGRHLQAIEKAHATSPHSSKGQTCSDMPLSRSVTCAACHQTIHTATNMPLRLCTPKQ